MAIVVTVPTAPAIEVQLQNVVLISVEGKKYEGEYDVTPSTYNDKVLATRNLVMTKDVTVQKIPQFEVSNTSNGKTLIIGEEYYG